MAENTPESELGSIECFQNYTAPEVFIQGLAGIVNQQDVESMIRAQKQMLQRFEKTNEMLSNCNSLSVSRLKVASSEFKKHTHLLTDMRKDLDNIFKRINILKSKLSSQYPQAFTAEGVQNSLFYKEDKLDTFSNEVNSGGKSASSKSSYGLATGINNTEKNDNIRFKDSAGAGEEGDEDDDNCFASHNSDDRKAMKRANSSSSDSNNGNSNNDSSPYTSDTG